MEKTARSSLICLVLVMLAGCAAPPISLDTGEIKPAIINGRSVSVIDLTKPSEGNLKMAAGYQRIADLVFEKPLGATMAADLAKKLQASGNGEALDVWLIDVGFYWEKTGADFVPLVNIFSFGRSGRFKCEAVISTKRGNETRRATIEQIMESIDTSKVGATEAYWKYTARDCYEGLLSKVTVAIQGI